MKRAINNKVTQLLKLIAVSCLMFVSGLAISAEDANKFDTPGQKALYQELADTLRCPKCQNQNIADSNAGIAQDLRKKVYKLVMEGQSKQQIIDFMVERYGYFVYYKPPVTPGTIILWVLPILFVLFTLVLIWSKSKKSQRSVDKSDWNDEQEEQLNALIAQIEQVKGQ